MTLPSVSPTKTFTCFSCQGDGVRPFSKIFKGHFIYHICKSECLPIALQKLGLINGDDRSFTSPVNITVQSPTSAFVNVSRSPINRSPASGSLATVKEDEDMDLKQIQELGNSVKRKFEEDKK